MQAKKTGLSTAFAAAMLAASADIFAWAQEIRSLSLKQDGVLVDLSHQLVREAQDARDASSECNKLLHEAVAAEVFGDAALQENDVPRAVHLYQRALNELQQAKLLLGKAGCFALTKTEKAFIKAFTAEGIKSAVKFELPFDQQKQLCEELAERAREVDIKLVKLVGRESRWVY